MVCHAYERESNYASWEIPSKSSNLTDEFKSIENLGIQEEPNCKVNYEIRIDLSNLRYSTGYS